MDKIKEKLHIGGSRRASQPDNDISTGTIADNRDSIDSELASMPPSERVAYLKEFDDSDKNDVPKKGGLLEKLIARGNKKTEDQIEREARERDAAAAQRAAAHSQVGPGAGASAVGTTGTGAL